MNIDSQNYWLNIDKPEGYSSAKIVAIVKRITQSNRVGHAGTLDPFATGVLPIAVGKATKTCQYITNEIKKYYCDITWGEFRDSDDKTGNVTQSNNLRPSPLQITNAISKFIGQIYQTPSSFSAIKVNGKRSYELARKGIEVKLKSRLITISQIKLISSDQEKSSFEMTCSKGTYVRSFARELSDSLGVCGYVSSLKRLIVGDFTVKNAISLEKLKNIVTYSASKNSLLQLRDVLNFIPEVELNKFDSLKIKQGQSISLSDSDNDLRSLSQKPVIKVIGQGALISLARIENNLLKPLNNF
ncbi:MAG: tRNA pseudouridine55 synthase [Lentimonas sp.]|jgi:tRNA pseudouridine55 synthase